MSILANFSFLNNFTRSRYRSIASNFKRGVPIATRAARIMINVNINPSIAHARAYACSIDQKHDLLIVKTVLFWLQLLRKSC